MYDLKANIPSPVSEKSDAFVFSLKVCLAAAAYDVPVQLWQGSGDTRGSVKVLKGSKLLLEPDAIVSYFGTIGANPWTGSEEEIAKQQEWIEAKEKLSSHRERVEDSLKMLENYLKELNTGSQPTPVEIISFSSLYDVDTRVLSKKYPASASWITKTLSVGWAKAGLETAATQCVIGPVYFSIRNSVTDDDKMLSPATAMKFPKPDVKILPIAGERNVLITSALPYVNNVPHLGNIIGSILSADVFSRYCKARNYNTLYICGTDEYGTATETKALEEHVTPQELCDKYNALHREIYEWFDIGFDHFGRTTTKLQTKIAQDIFLKLSQNDFLVENSVTQLFCKQHQGFLADRFVEGTCPKCGYEDARGDQCDACGQLLDPLELIDPRCKLDNHSPVKRDSKHIFLELDKLQLELEQWVKKSFDAGQWSRNGLSITENWLKQGLKKRCITRDLTWGTPVPLKGYEKKVLYVWFDACIGYLSITADYTTDWEKWWRAKEDVKLYQFMGKDNVPFHTVIFPGTQIGTKDDNWTMLHHLSTTEYLQYEGGKFSKSRGVGVFGNNARDTGVPSSVWRYYLLSTRPETSDAQFIWKDFVAKNNSELLANLGNFVNRIIKFVNAKYSSTVPHFKVDISFDEYKTSINKLLAFYIEDLENVRIRSGLERVMAISAEGNRFLQDNRLDNNLLANNPPKAAAVIAFGLNLVYLVSAVVYPYMPATAKSIVAQLNAPLRAIPDKWEPNDLLPGHKIGKAAYLFSRIDERKDIEWREKYGGKQETVVQEKKQERKKGKKAVTTG